MIKILTLFTYFVSDKKVESKYSIDIVKPNSFVSIEASAF